MEESEKGGKYTQFILRLFSNTRKRHNLKELAVMSADKTPTEFG
jgi:hypothetical protein